MENYLSPLIDIFNPIPIEYEVAGGAHFFTSEHPNARGLIVAAMNLEDARNECMEILWVLLSIERNGILENF